MQTLPLVVVRETAQVPFTQVQNAPARRSPTHRPNCANSSGGPLAQANW
jgi:hypothetical protein